MSELSVRPLGARDCPAVASLFAEARKATVPVVHSEGAIAKWLEHTVVPACSSLVIEDGGEVVAWMDAGGGWLNHLYVRNGHTGQGIGSQLLEKAKEANPDGLRLYTFQVNEGARRFYVRHGFEEEELGDGSGNEEGQPDVRMVWSP